MSRDGSRGRNARAARLATVLVVALVVLSVAAPSLAVWPAGASPVGASDATAGGDAIVYVTDSGLEVADASGGPVPNGSPFPDATTLDLPGITLSAPGPANVTVDRRNGTFTNLSAVDATSNVTVAPDDKGAVVLVSGIDDLNYTAVDYRNPDETDLGYVASSPATLTLNDTGLAPGTPVEATDADTDAELATGTVESGGSVTLTDLPTGTHDVVLTEADPPAVRSFGVTNPNDRIVRVEFVTDEPLVTAGVAVGGAESASLSLSAFTRTDEGDGTYTYTASYSGDVDGEYSFSLRTAVDAAGNDGAADQFDSVTVVTVDTGDGSEGDDGGDDGDGATDSVALSRNSLSFDGATVGEPVTRTVTISNPAASNETVTFADLRIAGPNATEFEATLANTSLAPGESTTASVTLTAETSGEKTATLQILTDGSRLPQVDVWLSSSSATVVVERSNLSAVGGPGTSRVAVVGRNVPDEFPVSVDVSGPTTRAAPGAVDEVRFVLREGGGFTLNVTYHDAVPESDVPALGTATDTEAIQYVAVEHSFSNEAVDDAAFTVRVRKSTIEELRTDPDAVYVTRYHDGEWQRHDARLVDETPSHYRYRVDIPGFSTFAIAAETPDVRLVSATTDRTEATTGDQVSVTATLRNDGGVEGTYEASLTVDGRVVATETVTVAPNATETIPFTRRFENPGTYTLAVDDATAGTVRVDDAGRQTTTAPGETTTTAPGETTTTAPGPRTAGPATTAIPATTAERPPTTARPGTDASTEGATRTTTADGSGEGGIDGSLVLGGLVAVVVLFGLGVVVVRFLNDGSD